ncbi:tumor protein p63-regulated gene 1 protein [Odontesthes bonariensis]|uniref:tumor protein p63-regulated gene 1 protein n=1 Tax=Odontesthes bonariensis TaxID=219752 RepID=UPI003F588FAC
MADEEERAPAEDQQGQLSSPSGGPADSEPTEHRAEEAGEQQSDCGENGSQRGSLTQDSCLEQFKIRKFFVLRPGSLDQAIKDVEALVKREVDGSVCSIWLMAEVDHWNNEKERLVLITDNSLLVFKYDFIMLKCEQFQRIQLNFVDRLSQGTFTFPRRSLLQREGEGIRVFWDRLREPSFISRWNPFATDYPFITFTLHPVRNVNDTFSALCDIQKFLEQLRDAAQKAHAVKPVPGRANGVMLLKQPIHIEAYVGAMSFLGNQNKLGYCMARGNVGF